MFAALQVRRVCLAASGLNWSESLHMLVMKRCRGHTGGRLLAASALQQVHAGHLYDL